jgi:hypothetical protein
MNPSSLKGRSSSATFTLHWMFRISVFMTWVGHGAFGIITKKGWLPYYAVFGIPESIAWRSMPIVGTMDVMLGVLTLLSPCRAFLLWGVTWCTFTACLRPLAGQGIWETLERAGNYGVPLAFLAMVGLGRSWREWFEPIAPGEPAFLDGLRRVRVATILRFAVGLLLIGHGGYGAFMHKEMLTQMYASAGLGGFPMGAAGLTQVIGWFELALGVTVIAIPLPGLLLFVAAWKVATEMLYPVTGYPFWEFIERGGSYWAPIALYFLLTHPALAPEPRTADLSPVRGQAA